MVRGLGVLTMSNKLFKSLPHVALLVAVFSSQGAFAQNTTMPQAVVKNRAPLQDVPFYALPLGSIKARGWLLHQLELQRDGLTGHAEEILPATKGDSAWLGGKGEDWEKGPYYVKGLVPLAYTLDDAALKAKAQKWIEGILTSQREDGFFGPKTNDDWWPRMVATYLLRDYAEATNDVRVVPFLSRYYRHMLEQLPRRPLRDWGRARAGDEMDTVFWLYNRTGDEGLLRLADLLYQQAYPWREIFSHNRFMEWGNDFHPKHNVNVPQALKMPPVYWQRSGNDADLQAYRLGHEHLMTNHGTAFGINSGTEFLSGRSSTQGIETCSTVEHMLSDETALRISGDASIGDTLEAIAFNALPASMSKSLRQHVYYTLPNNVTASRARLGFTQDYDDARTPSPRSGFPCCAYNLHMGWPKLAQNSWAATKENGLAFLAYVPSQVTARVGDGADVSFIAETNYPFEEEIRLKLKAPREVRFPLALRIPAWCEKPSLQVNEQLQKATPGQFATINRTWKNGDEVTLRFPMSVRLAPGVNSSRAVWHGPLLYSLQIAEKWQPFTTENREGGPGFESFEVLPTSPWNYALGNTFTVERRTVPKNPYEPEKTPVRLKAQARRIAGWTLDADKTRALDPPVSPIASDAPLETITLVPAGSQMLRVVNFPVLGTARPLTQEFQDNFPGSDFSNWVTYGGGWLVRDHQFGPSPDAPSSHAVATLTRFRDFIYEATVTPGEAGNAGLIFRVTKPTIGADAYDGYYFGLFATENRVELGKAGGKYTVLKAAPFALSPRRAYQVRIEARGPRMRIFVDNMKQPLIETEDASFAEGSIGVRQYGGNGEKAQSTFAYIKAMAL